MLGAKVRVAAVGEWRRGRVIVGVGEGGVANGARRRAAVEGDGSVALVAVVVTGAVVVRRMVVVVVG